MILVFLADFVSSRRSAGIFFSRGNSGDTDQFVAFIKIGFLVAAVDFDDGGSLCIVTFPVRDIIGNGRSWSAGTTGGGSMNRATDTGEVIRSRRFGIDAGNEEGRAGE